MRLWILLCKIPVSRTPDSLDIDLFVPPTNHDCLMRRDSTICKLTFNVTET